MINEKQKRIAIVTSTRAEYGLLLPLLNELRSHESDGFAVDLIVTGTHLSDEYGRTIDEIKNGYVRIDRVIEIPVKSETDADISNNQAETLIKFTSCFEEEQYDAVIILGDRYEMLAIAVSASNTRTPIIHLCGGDTTQGAMDEWIRHSITKMSAYHFVTNETSRKRVIQLGESPDTVFNFGSTGVDNILHAPLLEKNEALASVGLDACKYVLCTYHPVTIKDDDVDGMIEQFISAISRFDEYQFIITKSNADKGGARINALLDKAAEEHENIHVFTSLGLTRYLSLMKYCEAVLGNSSSGILEAPAFHIPTVNIGDRQKGRLQADTIINCGDSADDISSALNTALLPETKAACLAASNPYGNGTAAKRIAQKIIEILSNGDISLLKEFYDIDFTV
ncbi:MAG: UDP-N-acetylglucosamine 2-epimerase (hydrolyzing) [Eubacterium sp.]|nr:UDP-N-acetylglucosamine 2-epimerase (hydrolyzing) [Eubacterium sp.]